MAEEKDYRAEAESDALTCAEYFLDEMISQWEDSRQISDDLFNDYPNGDRYHHENHTDRAYSLREAVTIIEELSDFEETDTGLWQGQEMAGALSACAAYTYANCVMSEWRDLVSALNSNLEDIAELVEDNPPTRWYVECRPIVGATEEWETLDDGSDTKEEAAEVLEKILEENADEPAEFEYRIRSEVDDDATEDAVNRAGARYLRLYFTLLPHMDKYAENETIAKLTDAARRESESGEFTAALALADEIEELATGVDERTATSIRHRAAAIREAVA